MVKKVIILLISALMLLLLTSCYENSQGEQYATSNLCVRDQLAEMGYTDAHLEPLISMGMSFEDILYNISIRGDHLTAVAASTNDQVVQVGEVEVSRTGIAFMLENRTDSTFLYGDAWSLAYYKDGNWMPVVSLPGAVQDLRSIALLLQSGGIQWYHIEWGRYFGELSPGRYMFFRGGELSQYNQTQDNVYALVEFFITASSPRYLVPPHQVKNGQNTSTLWNTGMLLLMA